MSAEDSESKSERTEPTDDSRSAGVNSERRVLAVMLASLFIYVVIFAMPSCWPTKPIEVERSPERSRDLRIDLNRASWAELVQLPGVGPKLADRIIEDRKTKGPFRNLDDLGRVRGIGPALLERIGPYLTWQPMEAKSK